MEEGVFCFLGDFLLFLTEFQKSTGQDEENPLDGSVFKNIVAQASDKKAEP
jgi:hypothetical protein